MRLIFMTICLCLGLAGAAGAADAVELAFWKSVEEGGTRADYQAYLDRYPNGDFAELALNRLRESQQPQPVATASAPPDAALTKPERMRAQRALNRLGYDTRGVDGIFGPATRAAIRAWQEDHGLPVTGVLTRRQYERLTKDLPPPKRHRRNDEADWAAAKAAGTIEAYRRYLRMHPEGRHRQQAENRIERKLEKMAKRGATRAERREARLGLTRRQREEIEDRLRRAGYRPGPVDGVFDLRTRNAILDFRVAEGLPRSRYVDKPMLRRLVAVTGGPGPIDPNEDYSDFIAGAAVGALVLGGIVLLAD